MSIRGLQLVFYEGSGLDNAIGSNFDSRYDGRTCAHKAALADGNISTYGSPGSQVYVPTQNGIMVNCSPGVDYTVFPYDTTGLNHRPGHYLYPFT